MDDYYFLKIEELNELFKTYELLNSIVFFKSLVFKEEIINDDFNLSSMMFKK